MGPRKDRSDFIITIDVSVGAYYVKCETGVQSPSAHYIKASHL